MLIQEIIRAKRDGRALSSEEIAAVVRGCADGSASEGQVAAFAMAAFLNGLSVEETVALTQAMRDSGDVLAWDDGALGGPVLDKHSTGGVGDKVSLILAPIVAAAGGFVPMISGRGLGHTGGTLDKLDAIPGYASQPDIETFRRVVRETGAAIIGQTADLAPADRRLYAVRDVTATVESIPLITASILSKKLAAGLHGLAMDVKTGSGAFMASRDDARALARSIVDVAGGAGLPAIALITDMNQVLGRTAGNAVEVAEAVAVLRRDSPAPLLVPDPRLEEVTLALAGEMLALGGLATDTTAGRARAAEILASGAAAERFGAMVTALGGPVDFMERAADHLPVAPIVRPVVLDAGTVAAIDTRAVGLAVVSLGGGRRRAEDAVDHAVGLTRVRGLGEEVGPGEPFALVHARDEASADWAIAEIRAAVTVSAGSPAASPSAVLERLEAAS